MNAEMRTNERILSAPFSSVRVNNDFTQNHHQTHYNNPLISIIMMWFPMIDLNMNTATVVIIVMACLCLMALMKLTLSIFVDLFKINEKTQRLRTSVPCPHCILEMYNMNKNKPK
ncbi:unnamed protein product [Rotaria socialis]|uniref:Uncharacterized protein n=1 Tax=Rotaria socialis TaxID=392032 RepID=A0A820QCZ0_9BILA|nr:unnamed protein product [Rotaria socialis]CAF3241215.1 unnamed protein product [Rotaria socialis]CAF3713303.1 unnamed protein product [Rotaria socialis]CAF4416844.1 unnamed protein product [Rotaria socialis]CAF4579391.1 unnamed protein product [Rotaria socialis]